MSANPITYKHLVAGSVVHLQKPKLGRDDPVQPVKTITFHGKKGDVGFYTTSDDAEIEQLDYLANHPQVQVERMEVPMEVAIDSPHTISKPVDPAISAATSDVTESAARSADPAVVSAADRLAAVIAANKA